MNERTDLDRLLTAWLTADAPIREPEPLLGVVLARTARTHRRAAWRIPERWFPVSTITTRAAATSRFPWRTVGAVGLLVLALTVGAWVIADSRPKPLPAPFGPAHNGRIAYSVNGDIVAIDAPGAAPKTILGGADHDTFPWFSPDGSKFVFLRGAEGSWMDVWAADADGSGAKRLGGPVQFAEWQWSPSGDAVAMVGPEEPITMLAADGSGATSIDVGLQVSVPIFRPPDGSQLTFGATGANGTRGIYLMDRDGSDLVRLDLDPGFQADPSYNADDGYYFLEETWSPDGTRLMYDTLEPDPTSPAGQGRRIHIADVSASGAVTADRTLGFDPAADDEYGAAWLPSGDGIVFQSKDGVKHRMFVADLAPGSVARDLGVIAYSEIGSLVSPDGRLVALSVPSITSDRKTISVVDLATLTTTELATASDDWSWQRTAQ